MIVMRTASGMQCHINNNSRTRRLRLRPAHRADGVGGHGAVPANRKPHEMRRYSAKSGEVAEPYLYFFIERYTEAFMAEIDLLRRCGREGRVARGELRGRPPAPSSLAEAAYVSIKEKRLVQVLRDRLTPVRLPRETEGRRRLRRPRYPHRDSLT